MASLDLTDSPQTLVWRLIRDRLMADPVLSVVIKTWLVWDDSPVEGSDLANVTPPAIRMLPIVGAMSWYYSDTQKGPLIINVEAATPSLDVEDVMNLQFAFESCLYPTDRLEELAFERALVSAGAETGLITFDQPMQPDKPVLDQGGFRPLGRFSVDVLRRLLI